MVKGAVTATIATLSLLWFSAMWGDVDANSLTYSVTIRDFLPADCMRRSVYNDALGKKETKGMQDAYLDGVLSLDDLRLSSSSMPSIHSNYVTSNYIWRGDVRWSDHCPYFPNMMDDTISGHPDFETQISGQGFCGCNFAGVRVTTSKEYKCKNSKGSTLTPATGTKAQCAVPLVKFNATVSDSGLNKPEYHLPEGVRDPYSRSSSKVYFDAWYYDNTRYNKRVGSTIQLNETTPGIYQFSRAGGRENGPAGQYFPLNKYIDTTTQTTYPDYRDAPVWPSSFVSHTGNDIRHYSRSYPASVPKFWFTVEMHTFFQYRGGEEFTFNGDDDVFLFINGRLALDLSGIHSLLVQTLSLDMFATELGLEVGGIYELDLFQAERRYSESNFGVTTSLTDTCNVLKSGSQTNMSTWKVGKTSSVLSATAAKADLLLTNTSSSMHASTYAFLESGINVGAGFVASWKFEASHTGQHEGFAFVLHNSPNGLRNMPSSTGAAFNVNYHSNALAVVFDMCMDRNNNITSDCLKQSVALYYVDEEGRKIRGNSLKIETVNRKVHDMVMRTLKYENEVHTVRVEYLQTPDVIDVYLDNSLYLRARGVNLTHILGDSRNAFVGFTTATSLDPGRLEISDFTLDTVTLDANSTDAFELAMDKMELPAKGILADGVETAMFSVQTRDLCLNMLDSGGFAQSLTAKYVEAIDSKTGIYSNRSLTPLVIKATAVDNLDGTYGAELLSTVPGVFDLYLCFGDGCEVVINMVDHPDQVTNPGLQQPTVSYTGGGFTSERLGAVVVAALVPVPTLSPVAAPELGGGVHAETLQIGAIAGGVACGLFLSLLAVAVLLRSKWRRDRVYIEDGKLYNLDQDITYNKSDEFTAVGRQLLNTRAAVFKERARMNPVEDADAVVLSLHAENDELKEQIRLNKKKKQEQDADVVLSPSLAPRQKKIFSTHMNHIFSG